MDKDERQQDQELAAFTDALMEGQLPAACPDGSTGSPRRPSRREAGRPALTVRPPLAETVAALARALAPQPPPAHLRSAVRRRAIAAWPTPHPSFGQQLANLFRRPRRRWVWATVAALAAVAFAAALFIPNAGAPVTGTAAGDAGVAVLAVLGLFVIVLIAVWVVVRRKP